MSRSDDLLFWQSDWHSVTQNQINAMSEEMSGIPGDRLLNTAEADLTNYFVEKYRLDVPVLDKDGIYVDQEETQVDVSGDFRRAILDPSRPYYIPGTSVHFTVPFSGDPNMFRVRASGFSLNPPRAEVNRNTLVLTATGVDLDYAGLRAEFNKRIEEVERNLGRQRQDAISFNKELRRQVINTIQSRRNKLLADQARVASLGFPIRARSDAPQTYVTPTVRRVQPTLPVATTSPSEPEPVFTNLDYEHILSVMSNMVHVMERSPSTFANMGEEALRDHFLVQLNGHYEGKASAETFNYEGKTDILIRDKGRNIFIAECKFWNGPKSLEDTIDQLLGYTSWRDTKTAIVLFNRRKNFSLVLDAIPGAVRSHASFKRELDLPTETDFRYVLAHREDPNRELTLTVLAFDVPSTAKSD